MVVMSFVENRIGKNRSECLFDQFFWVCDNATIGPLAPGLIGGLSFLQLDRRLLKFAACA